MIERDGLLGIGDLLEQVQPLGPAVGQFRQEQVGRIGGECPAGRGARLVRLQLFFVEGDVLLVACLIASLLAVIASFFSARIRT